MKRPACWGLTLSAAGLAVIFLSGHAGDAGARVFGFALASLALVCVTCLIPGSSRLVVGEEGITLNQVLWRQHIRWERLRAFTLIDFDGTGIGLSPAWARYSVGYLVTEEQLPALSRLARKFHGFYGCHGSLPPVDGMSADELVALLNRALASSRRREEEA
ncbi:hypothetical protein [Luteolibacter sp. Populi]|uniref:hypothetical protein n=1 Tax=Luteolibacter sp. Populi TaxID=3230487 RepID=UPI003466FF6C